MTGSRVGTAAAACPGHEHVILDRGRDVALSPTPPAPGPIPVQGSKNVFLHLAALPFAGRELTVELANVPGTTDRGALVAMYREAGLSVAATSRSLTVAGTPTAATLCPDAVARLRQSVCYGAALATNLGRASFPLPGGDAFTWRPIDLHLRVLEAAGADCSVSPEGWVTVAFRRPARAFEVTLSNRFGPSLGATVTSLLVAAQATGTSLLVGASQEPEVGAVVAALRRLGVDVAEEAADCFKVIGTGAPLCGFVHALVPPDRMEAGTYLLAGLARQQPVRLEGISGHDLPTGFVDVLASAGAVVQSGRSAVEATIDGPPRPVRVATGPHPGFPTDLQPPLCAFLSQATGTSVVHETVYRSRTTHVGELARLGVEVGVEGSAQVIRGGQSVAGGRAVVHDIRCGAALLVAAVVSRGAVVLSDRGHLARGYSDLPAKLGRVGLAADGWEAGG